MNKNHGNRVNNPIGRKNGTEIRNGSGGTQMKPTSTPRPAPPTNINSNG